LLSNVIIGLLLILFGVFIVWQTYFYPIKNDNTGGKMKSYAGGIGCFVLGIMSILGKLHW